MNLRDLKYIIAVADSHHFSKAAEHCFVSQPTLSGQIKKLEEELGIVIFERTNRSVEVTPVGESIIECARLIMEQSELIRQLALAHQDPLAGPLRIGAIPTLSPYLLPLILLPLKNQYPQIQMILSEETTDILLERLHKHEIDAALLATTVDDPEYDVLPLFDEPFWLAYPRDHPFYYQDNISRADLEKTELLLLSEGYCLAKQAMDICHLQQRKERGVMADFRASSLETLLHNWLASGSARHWYLHWRWVAHGPVAAASWPVNWHLKMPVVASRWFIEKATRANRHCKPSPR